MNSPENDGKDPMWSDEARLSRFVNAITFTRCVIGPLVLFGLLLGTAYWEPSNDAQSAYFPAQYANAANVAEDHVQAF